MSKIVEVKVVVTDFLALHQAAVMLGLELKPQKTFRTYGQRECDWAIAVPDNPNAMEIGVLCQPNGEYKLLYDEDLRGLKEYVGEKACDFIQEYSVQAYVNMHPGASFEFSTDALTGDRLVQATYH